METTSPPINHKLNGNIATPNRARRNLSDSFDYTSDYTPKSLNDTPIINYSVVEDESENEDGLKLKLRISEKQTQPQVILERLSKSRISSAHRHSSRVKITNEISREESRKNFIEDETPVRRSSRNIPRVSYVEPHVPSKTRTRSNDSIETNHFTPKKKIKDEAEVRVRKLQEIQNSPSQLGFEEISISSPRKRNRKQNHKENVYLTPSKRDRQEELKTPSTRTPRRSTRLASTQVEADIDALLSPIVKMKFSDLPNPEEQLRTPKRMKKSEESAGRTPRTPKTPSTLKLIRSGVIVPSMHVRESSVAKARTPLDVAKAKLHVSYVPKGLPCREKEFEDITAFVAGKLTDGCGGCMYISGVPGTGKTATATEAIRQLQAMAKKGKVGKFTFVSINGMRLSEPRQSYVEILKQLTNKTVAWEQAQSMLDARFTKPSRTQQEAIVLLVDELDILCTKRQDVVYNLLDWPTRAKAQQLIVLTIANTMDLPERLLMGRVTSRLGLTRLTFQAYTHKQLQEIVMQRLTGTHAFHPDAVQLVARKVASVSGDARRALDICRRAAEVAELDDANTPVGMQHVNEALSAMITQPKVQAIKRCSRLERLLLQAVAAEVERTGVDESSVADVYAMLASIAAIDGFAIVSISVALAAIARLGSCRLLLTDTKSSDLHQRLILNVSVDDIYYALRRD